MTVYEYYKSKSNVLLAEIEAILVILYLRFKDEHDSRF